MPPDGTTELRMKKKGSFSPAGGAGLNRCQAYCKELHSGEKIIFFN
jgi:hypothetical protein